MKKTLWVVLILMFSGSLSAQTSPVDIDCGRMVKGGNQMVPLNLCFDGTIPEKGCKCPGTVKWVPPSQTIIHVARAEFVQPKTQFAFPPAATPNEVRYPILNPKRFNAERVTSFGLHLEQLKKSVEMLNHHRNIDRFVYETIPAGTWVYADATGNPIYKADCFNLLVTLNNCPKCNPIPPATSKPPGVSGNTAVTSASTLTGWDLLGDLLKNAGHMLAAFAKFAWNWLLPLLLILALLALAAVILYGVYRAIADDMERERREREERERREREERERREGGVVPGPVAAAPRMPIADVPPPASATAVPAIVPILVPRPTVRPTAFESGASSSSGPVPISARGAGETPEPASGSTIGSGVPSGMRFVVYYPAEKVGGESKLRFNGWKSVKLNEEGGVTTIVVS